jgi:Polyketide cyclase / dehydrase and lipid transport
MARFNMARITVSIELDAPVAVIWDIVEPIERHVDWMHDAVAIRFETDQTRGVGTRFVCDTKVGPIRLTDRMEITDWRPREAMGVRHDGLVTGVGVFTLDPIDLGRRTRFTWSEGLTFPWWMGGPLAGWLGGTVVLGMIWRRNLANLAKLVDEQRNV